MRQCVQPAPRVHLPAPLPSDPTAAPSLVAPGNLVALARKE
jgi:hypothetical protein